MHQAKQLLQSIREYTEGKLASPSACHMPGISLFPSCSLHCDDTLLICTECTATEHASVNCRWLPCATQSGTSFNNRETSWTNALCCILPAVHTCCHADFNTASTLQTHQVGLPYPSCCCCCCYRLAFATSSLPLQNTPKQQYPCTESCKYLASRTLDCRYSRRPRMFSCTRVIRSRRDTIQEAAMARVNVRTLISSQVRYLS